MNINFPDISPASSEDKTTEHLDNRYSGTYLITSLHHKINIVKHMITMEVIRDSISPDTPNFKIDTLAGGSTLTESGRGSV
jgi:hypothetical protein